jgi:predicted transport protein
MEGVRVAEIVFLKSVSDTEIKEAEIQSLFEKHLKDFEEGLRFVSSYLGVGVGVIDTLAIDEDFRPVIIEYKKPGNSDKDALIQALHYYYWCTTHFEWIDKAVRKFKPELLKGGDVFTNDIRIMIVAGEYDEHVKGAAYGVEPDTQLIEYDICEGDKKGIVFKAIVDSSKADRMVRPPKAEDDHFKDKEALKTLYGLLRERILSFGTDAKAGTPTQDYLPFMRRVTFCQVHVKKKWLRLDLRNIKDVKHPKIIPYPVGDWVYVHVEKEKDIDEVLDLIKRAYERAA